MTQSIITERAKSIAEMPNFAMCEWWLTFYLSGDARKLESIGTQLAARGGVNTGEGGNAFLYPKLKVANDPALVAQLVAEVQRLAIAAKVELVAIDVDTTSEIGGSLFEELIRFDGNGG